MAGREGGLTALTLPEQALIVSNRKFGLPFWELIWQINADKMQATGQGQSWELEAGLGCGFGSGTAAALHGPTNRILMIVAWSAFPPPMSSLPLRPLGRFLAIINFWPGFFCSRSLSVFSVALAWPSLSDDCTL